MPTPSFPVLSKRPDQKEHEVSREDTTIKAEVDGGYEFRRERHTRRPRRTFKTGYQYLTEADKAALESFYDQVRCSTAFNWTAPDTNETVLVQFNKPLSFKYQLFIAGAHTYSCTEIEMKEV
jgi:phage-related protein